MPESGRSTSTAAANHHVEAEVLYTLTFLR